MLYQHYSVNKNIVGFGFNWVGWFYDPLGELRDKSYKIRVWKYVHQIKLVCLSIILDQHSPFL